MQTKSEMINRIAELARENTGLKAENDRLKARKDKYYQQTLDDEIKLNELYQTLQEIKTIAEENKDTAQYGGICKSILMIITKAEEK